MTAGVTHGFSEMGVTTTASGIGQEPVMTKRERFVTPVTCPQCALNGSATWEESERGNLETTLKGVSDGFKIDGGQEIYCASCGVKAIVGRTVSRSEMK